MEIRIGIAQSPRELSFESSQSPDEIEQTVSAALAAGTGHLSLKDTKGKLYLVPVVGLSYVEIGSEENRRIGFVG
ncbi:MAG: ATP-binding protein [Subtercola sp.]|nr:ATP-binding protein [Subtercola sp.]